MASVIFKHELTGKMTLLTLSDPHKILKVGFQGPHLYAWILQDADPNTARRDRAFHMIATGEVVSAEDMDRWAFVGTAESPVEVWHVFANWRPWDR